VSTFSILVPAAFCNCIPVVALLLGLIAKEVLPTINGVVKEVLALKVVNEPDVPLTVVKAPVLGVVLPIAPGAAQVPLSKLDAFIVPELAKPNEAPVSTVIVAEVFVPVVIPLNGTVEAGTELTNSNPVPVEFTLTKPSSLPV
jgi:hypothetical protein